MTPKSFKRAGPLTGLILLATAAAPAWAVTYSYTGMPMTSFTGDRWPTGTNITATIEATEKLSGGVTLSRDPRITSFAFTAGSDTWDSAGTLNFSSITTDETGDNVLFWNIDLEFTGVDSENNPASFSLISECTASDCDSFSRDQVDAFTLFPEFEEFAFAQYVGGPSPSERGTWTVSTTTPPIEPPTPAPIPLPASLPLLGVALAGLFGAGRSRRRTA